VTPIEKIRAEVAELLRNHAANETRPHFCRAGHASPCAVYELAQDKLRLAEWIYLERLASDDVRFEFAAQSVLEEVAR
jgi:hypothetical protein